MLLLKMFNYLLYLKQSCVKTVQLHTHTHIYIYSIGPTACSTRAKKGHVKENTRVCVFDCV